MGATNTNIEDIKSLEVNDACGIKSFLGASTGDLLVDDPLALELLFEHAPIIVVTHCEDTPLIREMKKKRKKNMVMMFQCQSILIYVLMRCVTGHQAVHMS